MNKTELIATVARSTGYTKTSVKEILEASLAQITETVKAGDEIVLLGFGIFKSTRRGARKGRNPSTGESVDIPAATYPKFIPGKNFKEAVK